MNFAYFRKKQKVFRISEKEQNKLFNEVLLGNVDVRKVSELKHNILVDNLKNPKSRKSDVKKVMEEELDFSWHNFTREVKWKRTN